MPADERSTAGSVSHKPDGACHGGIVWPNGLAGWSCIYLQAAGVRVAAATHCVEDVTFIVNNLDNLRVFHGLSITYELGQRVL